MSLTFLVPAGLIALTALLLPLILHLDRQSKSTLVSFAALRWLSSSLRPQKQFRLTEWLLLLLRLLLVAALAALLAGPALLGGASSTPWVVVTPGLDVSKLRALQDTDNEKAQWHWLADGFPAINAPVPSFNQPTASLLRELDAMLPAKTRVTVVVPTLIENLDDELPQFSRRMIWHTVSDRKQAPAKILPNATSTLVVRYAPEHTNAVRYFRAAASAWKPSHAIKQVADVADSTHAIPSGTRWLVWLVPGKLPASVVHWIRDGGVAMLDVHVMLPEGVIATAQWRDDTGDVLASGATLGRGRIIVLARVLQPAKFPELLEADFPKQLHRLFTGLVPKPVLAAANTWRPSAGSSRVAETPRPLAQEWALLIALLFVLERLLASAARRQRVQ